jgi:nucleoid-associated protein YgaU
MGCVQQAVLEFDEEIQAPWRPRLVAASDAGGTVPAQPVRALSSRSPSRVGICRPSAAPARPVHPVRRATPRPDDRAVTSGARLSAGTRPSARRPAAGRSTVSRPAAVQLRLTRRARRLAAVLAMAAAVALGSWLGPLLGGGDELRLAGGSSVVVQSGDTLWSIASSMDEDGDVRALVDEIQRINGLAAAELLPGQILQLP